MCIHVCDLLGVPAIITIYHDTVLENERMEVKDVSRSHGSVPHYHIMVSLSLRSECRLDPVYVQYTYAAALFTALFEKLVRSFIFIFPQSADVGKTAEWNSDDG